MLFIDGVYYGTVTGDVWTTDYGTTRAVQVIREDRTFDGNFHTAWLSVLPEEDVQIVCPD